MIIYVNKFLFFSFLYRVNDPATLMAAAQAPPMFYPPVAPQATLPLAYYGAPNPYASHF